MVRQLWGAGADLIVFVLHRREETEGDETGESDQGLNGKMERDDATKPKQ